MTNPLPPKCPEGKHKYKKKGALGLTRICKICHDVKVVPLETRIPKDKYL